MAVEDAYQTRMVQHELSRRYVDCSLVDVRVIHGGRYVDCSLVDVRVIHGVCYLRGIMKRLRSHPEVDLDHEAEVIRKILRQRVGIRDVVWEVQTKQ
jgi:hypothetical protein